MVVSTLCSPPAGKELKALMSKQGGDTAEPGLEEEEGEAGTAPAKPAKGEESGSRPTTPSKSAKGVRFVIVTCCVNTSYYLCGIKEGAVFVIVTCCVNTSYCLGGDLMPLKSMKCCFSRCVNRIIDRTIQLASAN